MRLRRPAVAAAGIALALLLGVVAACSPAKTGSASKSANVYLYQAPKSFNPLLPFAGAEQQVMTLIYDNLFSDSPDFKYIPRLAKSWDVSSDARTFTFHLRSGLKWSDGEPFSSKDVLFTYNAVANPKVASGQAARLSDVVGFDDFKSGKAASLSGLSAPDDNTFVIKLATTNSGFLSLIGAGAMFFILPEHILKDVAADKLLTAPFFQKPTVGMGPFQFVSYRADQQVTLKKNPNFRTAVKLDNLNLKVLTSDVATAQLQTGEMDLVQIGAPDLSTVQGLDNVAVSEAPSPGFWRVAFNTSKPALQNALVRQAMTYAVNRAGIVKTILKGKGSAINTSIMTPWAIPSDLNTYDYNPAKARDLLKQAGWKSSTQVKLGWVPGTKERDDQAAVVIANLKSVGINAVASTTDAATYVQNLKDKTWDLVIYPGGTYPPDPETAAPILSCNAAFPIGGNIGYWCNKDFDAAMTAGAAATSQADRAKAYQSAARIENEQVPMMWLSVPQVLFAHSKRLTGFVPHGDFTYSFATAADWDIKS